MVWYRVSQILRWKAEKLTPKEQLLYYRSQKKTRGLEKGELFMRKMLFAFATLSILLGCLVAMPNQTEATDTWIKTSEGMDFYVIDETVKKNGYPDLFCVNVKLVKDGKIIKTEERMYAKFKSEYWTFGKDEEKNSPIRSFTYKDEIFEYCMGKLGWKYTVVDKYDEKRYS